LNNQLKSQWRTNFHGDLLGNLFKQRLKWFSQWADQFSISKIHLIGILRTLIVKQEV